MRVAFYDGLENLLSYARNNAFQLVGVNICSLYTQLAYIQPDGRGSHHHGKRLPATRLSIGEDGAIVAVEYI